MKTALLLTFLLFTIVLFSQKQGTIKGTIVDLEVKNEPMLFANVSLKHTSKKTQTNFRGNFEINAINPGNYTLVVSYAGYKTVEILVRVKKKKTTTIHTGLAAMKIEISNTIFLENKELTMIGSHPTSEN